MRWVTRGKCARTVASRGPIATDVSQRHSSGTGLGATQAFVLVAALILLCGSAHAQSKHGTASKAASPSSAQYEQLLDRAVEAFEASDFERARVLFRQAYALNPNARVLRGLGIADFRLAHYTDANRELSRALSETNQALTSTQRSEVSELVSWMRTNLGVVRVRVQPTNGEVSVDDEQATDPELVLTPGRHRVSVRANGYRPEERPIDISAGQYQELKLTLTARTPTPVASAVSPSRAAAALPETPSAEPSPAPPSESHSVFTRWWFWGAVGAIVIGGTVTAFALTNSATPSYERGAYGGVIQTLGRHP